MENKHNEEEELKTQLEVGDIVIAKSRYHDMTKYKIERVTKTQAISGNTRFYRELERSIHRKDATVRLVGGYGSWNAPIYYLSTPELLEEYDQYKKKAKLKRIDWEKMPKDAIDKIYDILISTMEKSTNDTI